MNVFLIGVVRAARVAVGLFAAAASAVAQVPDESDIWERFEAQDQASGRFVQELFAEDGSLLETSEGRYAVLKPGFFRWEIEEPDRQLILVSGEVLWHYDIDLATATRRPSKAQGEFTPLELLAGEGDELRERFRVEALEAERYRLIPTFAGAGFGAVELTWAGTQVVGMRISDRSGQQITLALTPDSDPASLSASDFEFTVPDGVDVFDGITP